MFNNKKPALIKDLGMMFPAETSKQKVRFGIYKCFCGDEFRAMTPNITSGSTQTCGCTKNNHGLSKHRLYNTWKDMIRRTYNPKYRKYMDYGGRGIKVCERWMDISLFVEDMYPTFKEGLSIERMDVNGNYEPSNCIWETRSVQARNKRLIMTTNTTGYRGIFLMKKTGRYRALIQVDSIHRHIGYFDTALEAAIAYDTYIIDNKLEHTINNACLDWRYND